jgi:hypothetical protein
MSKNKPTIEHLKLACRHVQELMAAGVTENLAIRTLEVFADIYGKMHHGGSATPHHVEQVPRSQWSIAAKKSSEENPAAKAGHFLRVEHGTPRRAFARMVLKLYEANKLSEQTMGSLCRSAWKLAVITIEEDSALNKVARSKVFSSPDERWQAAGIRFVED